MRKAILKLNWNLSYMGDVDDIMKVADALDRLMPVEFQYLDEHGGVYVEREDCSEYELQFLNCEYLTREEYLSAKGEEKEAA